MGCKATRGDTGSGPKLRDAYRVPVQFVPGPARRTNEGAAKHAGGLQRRYAGVGRAAAPDDGGERVNVAALLPRHALAAPVLWRNANLLPGDGAEHASVPAAAPVHSVPDLSVQRASPAGKRRRRADDSQESYRPRDAGILEDGFLHIHDDERPCGESQLDDDTADRCPGPKGSAHCVPDGRWENGRAGKFFALRSRSGSSKLHTPAAGELQQLQGRVLLRFPALAVRGG